MTNKNLTQLLLVVDRSGSMHRVASDMRGAIDEYFDNQAKQDGECRVDYAQFDTEYELVYADRPVSEAKAVLNPRGGTALLDAIGKSVTDLGEKLRKQKESERPGMVIVVVVTDGYENSSVDWTREAVKDLISEQESKYNWEFVFLGANMDAVNVGQSFGFKGQSSLTYDTSYAGATMSNLSSYTTRSRSGVVDNSFSDEERLTSVGG